MPTSPDREKLSENLRDAVREYVEAHGGHAWKVGEVKISVHKATSFDVVIEVVGEPPKPGRSGIEQR
ncbi:MAG TPA: hypothetical protein VGD45_20775 [Steroidobacter sp.]|uniref:hypothetical protein n=1 Tax=Steroidobacter sp. TaxID=1978227 RepID=UPI002ED89457